MILIVLGLMFMALVVGMYIGYTEGMKDTINAIEMRFEEREGD